MNNWCEGWTDKWEWEEDLSGGKNGELRHDNLKPQSIFGKLHHAISQDCRVYEECREQKEEEWDQNEGILRGLDCRWAIKVVYDRHL